MIRRRGRFSAFGPLIAAGAARGLYRGATEIMDDSLPLVPVETGTLKASGRVLEPEHLGDHIEVRAGYGYGEGRNPTSGEPAAGYAVYVHEILEHHHDPPTQAKFLEQPALEHKPRLGTVVAVEIRNTLRGAKEVLR